jgi:FkbM family methyltransferase
MKLIKSVWLPDSDTHFGGVMDDKGYYQVGKFNAAIKYVKKAKVFVDIGAHCGLWSRMARDAGFKKTYAYEALPEHIQCYKKNLEGYDYEISQCVLGNDEFIDVVASHTGNSGGTFTKQGERKVTRFDDIFTGDRIDLMKIDVQGMERKVLEGAMNSIMRFKPVIIVEQKQEKDALEYLEALGFKRREKISGDYIYDF